VAGVARRPENVATTVRDAAGAAAKTIGLANALRGCESIG
jgi:heterodisulfide reductase subunit A-like polyferredoxin